VKSYTPIAIIAVGLVLVALGLLMQEMMPLIGRAAFQVAGAGTYSASNYGLDLTRYNIVAGVILLLGSLALVVELRNQ